MNCKEQFLAGWAEYIRRVCFGIQSGPVELGKPNRACDDGEDGADDGEDEADEELVTVREQLSQERERSAYLQYRLETARGESTRLGSLVESLRKSLSTAQSAETLDNMSLRSALEATQAELASVRLALASANRWIFK